MEESFGARHAHQGPSNGGSHGERSGTTVALLHAWIWLENPAGPFAADNWALPFARLGYAPPAALAPDAARALSLLSGGDVYYRERIHALLDQKADPSPAIVEARVRVARWAADHPPGCELGESDLAGLAAVWQSLIDDLTAELSPEDRGRLAPLR
jgi:hypothetical protein